MFTSVKNYTFEVVLIWNKIPKHPIEDLKIFYTTIFAIHKAFNQHSHMGNPQ